MSAAQAHGDGHDGRADTGGGLRAAGTGPAALGRRGHAAVPGRRDRLQAARHGHAVGGRRRRHRHREPLRRALPLRRRAGPHGRRHPHRQPPRRRPRRAPPVGRAGDGATTSGPARRWWSPALAADGETSHLRRPPRRPRATRTSSASCGRSAPTSSASTEASSPLAASLRSAPDSLRSAMRRVALRCAGRAGRTGAALRLAPTRFARQCVGSRLAVRSAVHWPDGTGPGLHPLALRLAPASLRSACVGRRRGAPEPVRRARSLFLLGGWPPRRARPRPAPLGAWPGAGARPGDRWARAPSASRPTRPGGRDIRSPAAWPGPCRWCGSRPRSCRPCRR